MSQTKMPMDISAELSALKHEMKNQQMKALPSNMTVQRRPLHHPAVASPFAGADIQKVVYVSGNTPIMSAVKRVRKLLLHAEKRALQGANAMKPASARTLVDQVDASNRLERVNEEVLVKASGRAMQQALRIGEWFRTKEKEMICNVEVRTGSIQTVDDIIEVEGPSNIDEEANEAGDSVTEGDTTLEGGETTLELLGDTNKSTTVQGKGESSGARHAETQPVDSGTTKSKRKRRPKRKRAKFDVDDVPEARLRWIKTVEVAISLHS